MGIEKAVQQIGPGDCPGAEFMRTVGVERNFGLKRGTLYNLLGDEKIRGVLLRCRGQKSGLRLWDVGSIRAYINSQAPTQPGLQARGHKANSSRPKLRQATQGHWA